MSRKLLGLIIIFMAVALSIEHGQIGLFKLSSGLQDSDGNFVVTVERNGSNIIVKMDKKIIYNNSYATQGIQRAINYLSAGGEVYIYNGTYHISDRLNITEGIYVHGQGNSTVLDYTTIGEEKNAIAMSKGSHLSDMELSGSLSPLPKDFTQAIRTDDDSIIENVSIYKMGYGIDTTRSKNVTLVNIKCQFIQSIRDWAACIHAANTENLFVKNFRVADSNRGIELDAATTNVTVQNGEIIRVKNFNNTGHEAFTLDAHSHDGEGGLENISFKNVTLMDSYAPSVKVASENAKYATNDLPRKVLFENITVINPTSSWQVNGDDVTLKDIKVINSTQDIVILYKNSRNILVQNISASPISADKCFICNTKKDADIKNLTIINNTATVNANKVGPTMSFYGIEGLSIIKNRIVNAPRATDAINTKSVSDLNSVDNDISYFEKVPVRHSNGLLNIENLLLNAKYPLTISILPFEEYDKFLFGGENTIHKISEKLTNDAKKEYKNETYGIEVQYPSDWRRIDWRSLSDFLSFYDVNPNDNFTEVVQLYSRYQGSSDKYAEGIDIAVQNLTQKPRSVNEYRDQAIEYYKQYTHFQLVESSTEDFFLSDAPAYRLVFTFVSDSFNLKWMEIGTIKHNKLYRVIFFAENETYDEYLPIAQQIINSFEIAGETQNDNTSR